MNNDIVKFILETQAEDVLKYDEIFLKKSIERRLFESRCETEEDYIAKLGQNNEEAKAFIDSLQINYSEFFRNTLTFGVLKGIVFPALAMRMKSNNRKMIRLWSAACASGHEAYSLAMLMEEMSKGERENIRYRIFATDKSEEHLKQALKGHYDEEAMNNVSMKHLRKWFSRKEHIYTVKAELKEHIYFSVFDLLEERSVCPPDSIFGDFDVAICSNLLFYYNDECRKKILEKVGNCLSEGGYLVCGEAEREILKSNGFREVYEQSCVFQAKGSRQ